MAEPRKLLVREARDSDAEDILKIYAPFVEDTFASLEYEVPTVQEMRSRIKNTLEGHPYLVCVLQETPNKICGYAYGSQHRVREGYKWVSETSVYVSEEFRGHGIGTLLYTKLLEILKMQGFVHALAIIGGDNELSVKFHKNLGFTFIPTFSNYGVKFGKFSSVSWFTKPLHTEDVPPPKPTPYSKLDPSLLLTVLSK